MATQAEIWTEVLELEEWLDRAREEVDELNPADECEYEYVRACQWLGYLEDLADIKRRGLADQ